MSGEHFIKVNGFSNRYWGWGAEDDDMKRRIDLAGLPFTRQLPRYARYTEGGLGLDSRSADKELNAVKPEKSKACVTTFTKKVGA